MSGFPRSGNGITQVTSTSGTITVTNGSGPTTDVEVAGGAAVLSVTAADTSVVVGGTATAPTVRTNTLDVIAADHAPVADWSNNSHKITSVKDASAAGDAANAELTAIIVQNKTGTYQANVGDMVLDAAAASHNVTAPTTPATGQRFGVKKTDSDSTKVITINTSDGTTLDGAATLQLIGQGAGYVFVFDGTNWQVVSTAASVWTAYTPVWTSPGGNPAIGNGTLSGAFQQVGRTIHAYCRMVAGSTTTFGGGHWIFTLPATAANPTPNFYPNSIAQAFNGSSYPVWVQVQNNTNTMNVGTMAQPTALLDGTHPFSWGTGNDLDVGVVTYQAAL